MATKKISVCVTRCEKCGRERFGFAPHKSNCPRCASPLTTERWISDPAPESIAQAAEEGIRGTAVHVRILARAAEYDRIGDVAMRAQALTESEASVPQITDFWRRVRGGENALMAAVYATL